nr:protein kinase [Deltaproteobacteria bacterium]
MKQRGDTTAGNTISDDEDSTEEVKLETFDRPDERFQLGEELGRGGMGRVIAATDVSLARSVAIKQVLSSRPDDLARFEREVRITAQLEHPSIVPIHEAARDANGTPFYVMRRIEGDPLSKRLTGADLPTRLALLPNLLSVIDAAAFAHARKIIHRDIKPSNILLGAYGETHLIDWGLARRLDDLDHSVPRPISSDAQLTRAGHIYGTVGYMAPEQARGEPVDMRADVYALGATLFHVLAGVAPFSDLSDAERLAAAGTGEDRVPLHKLGDEIAPELVAIVEKAMTREPAARYQHAGDLAADLRAFLGGKLVAAHRYTAAQRLARFVRKHRFAVALSVASFVVVVTVIVFAVVNMVHDQRETKQAYKEAVQARADAEAEQKKAESRSDLLLIQRASSLAMTDPTRAAALLLHVPLGTPHARLARDTIARVAAQGVVRGNKTHTQQINALAFSADQTRLASIGNDGLVVVYDVATGKSDVIVDLKASLYAVAWIDDHTLLISGDRIGGFRVVDIATRLARPFGHNQIGPWWRFDTDRIRY